MTTITALPTPPSRQDPTNFNDRADAFLGALPAFATEANAVASETNTASANAVAANQAVIAATNITKWVSGTTYANGAVVWSPINGLAYRRITASGSGTTDPSLDTTNYKQVNGTGDVSTSGNQTISGVKTFSSGIALGVDLAIADGGTGASTAATAFDNLKQAATTSSSGVLEIATNAEIQQGTAGAYAITAETFVLNKVSSGTAVTASGTSIDFTGIPSWAKRITVMFYGVSTNGSSLLRIRLGTSGGIESSGYIGDYNPVSTDPYYVADVTDGIPLNAPSTVSASYTYSGAVTFVNISGNKWIADGSSKSSSYLIAKVGGYKELTGALDRVRLTMQNGTQVFDAGTINILWE